MRKIQIINIVLFLIISSCCSDKFCEGFNSDNIYFVPSNLEENDTWTITNNYGNSITFFVDDKYISESYNYSSCDDCACEHMFILDMESINSSLGFIKYNLQYDNEKSKEIEGRITIADEIMNFNFSINQNGITSSDILHDSLIINTIAYYDIIELSSDRFDKVFLSKEHGLIKIVLANSDTVWVR